MAVKPKRILLITTKQPSSNPRLVKEAIVLYNAGYDVTVLYNFWSVWADETDKEILQSNKGINWQRVNGHPVQNKIYYWYTRLRHKIYKILAAKFPRNIFLLQRAEAQFFPELMNAAKKMNAALYIAHNLGALPVAAKAAKINLSKYAFVAEDYHRSMAADDSEQLPGTSILEDKYLPGCAYITAASPLIAAAYRLNYPAISFTVINNFFSKQLQPAFNKFSETPLKLFWFSQTIGLNRGLQDAIAAMNEILDFKIECTIVGDATGKVKQALMDMLKNPNHSIHFKQPCTEKQLMTMASSHHIGLALEPGFSKNNNIALSNKLFTYLLAGNAVILSATEAQQFFFQQYPSIGWLYEVGNVQAFGNILRECNSDKGLLEEKRKNAWQLAADELNWENESVKFTGLVQTALQ